MTQVRKYRRAATPKQAAERPGALDRLLDPALFGALADPTRARLIACIAKCGRGCSVGEVAECCSVDLSVVSRHLALLARSGVLESSKDGRVVRYRVRYEEMEEKFRALADALGACCPSSCGCQPEGSCDGCC